jgi:hypothetical protein
MKKVIIFIFLLFSSLAYSEVPVAVLPFSGEGKLKNEIQEKLKELITSTGGLNVVAENLNEEIMKTHEKAQLLGSDKHNAEQLKTAEYLISGEVSDDLFIVKAVNVNSGVEIFNRQIEIKTSGKIPDLKRTALDLADAILFAAAPSDSDIPDEAKPYMDLVRKFTDSLTKSDEFSYPYMAQYFSGSYRHPEKGNKKMEDSAKLQLKIVKAGLLRAKLTFIKIKQNRPWMEVFIIADKSGIKAKYKFSIIELEDGTNGIGVIEQIK